MYICFVSSFLQAIIAVANADSASTSLKDRVTFTNPQPLLLRKMAALIHTQLRSGCGLGGVGGDRVLQFWLSVLLSYPNWHKYVHLLYGSCEYHEVSCEDHMTLWNVIKLAWLYM